MNEDFRGGSREVFEHSYLMNHIIDLLLSVREDPACLSASPNCKRSLSLVPLSIASFLSLSEAEGVSAGVRGGNDDDVSLG
jgi:hypothetical protein